MFFSRVCFTAYMALLTEDGPSPNVDGLGWHVSINITLLMEGKCANSRATQAVPT